MSEDTGIHHLRPVGRPDAEVAAEIKAKLAEALKNVAAIMDEAAAAGFQTDFAMGKNYEERAAVVRLNLIKVF